MIEYLVDEYFKLVDYSKDKENFDLEHFKMIHDNLASKYKKLDDTQQGEYTHLVVENWISRGY